MARYSGAQWRPISVNHYDRGNSPRLLIVHYMQGTLAGTDSWFRNPAAEVSAHFGIGKTGLVYQWLDTLDRAWHAVNANGYSIGLEFEGYVGQTLTAAQINQAAKLYAWSHKAHPNIAMQIMSDPAKITTGSGLTYHSLGGAAWGGHNDPGPLVVAQLPTILAKAKAILNPPPPPPPPPPNIALNTGEDMVILTRKNGMKDVFGVADGTGYHQAVATDGTPKSNDTLATGLAYFVNAFWDSAQTTLTAFAVGSAGGVYKMVWSAGKWSPAVKVLR